MSDRTPIEDLLRALRPADQPVADERAAARRALNAAISDERQRVERASRPIRVRLGMAFAAVTPLVLAAILISATVGPAAVAASLDSVASGAHRGVLVDAGGMAATESLRWTTGPDGRTHLDHVILYVAADGSRFEVGVGSDAGLAPRFLPPLPDPSLLPLDPQAAYAYMISLVDPGAAPGEGSTVIDIAVGLLLDPRLGSEARATVLRALAEVPGIRRVGVVTGTFGYSVTTGLLESTIVLTTGGRVVEHRVVLAATTAGRPPSMYSARFGVTTVTEVVAPAGGVDVAEPPVTPVVPVLVETPLFIPGAPLTGAPDEGVRPGDLPASTTVPAVPTPTVPGVTTTTLPGVTTTTLPGVTTTIPGATTTLPLDVSTTLPALPTTIPDISTTVPDLP